MNREKYDEIRGHLTDIDKWSNLAEDTAEVLADLKENGGSAKLHIFTKSSRYEVELIQERVELILQKILKEYHNLIRGSKGEIDNLINSTIIELN